MTWRWSAYWLPVSSDPGRQSTAPARRYSVRAGPLLVEAEAHDGAVVAGLDVDVADDRGRRALAGHEAQRVEGHRATAAHRVAGARRRRTATSVPSSNVPSESQEPRARGLVDAAGDPADGRADDVAGRAGRGVARGHHGLDAVGPGQGQRRPPGAGAGRAPVHRGRPVVVAVVAADAVVPAGAAGAEACRELVDDGGLGRGSHGGLLGGLLGHAGQEAHG